MKAKQSAGEREAKSRLGRVPYLERALADRTEEQRARFLANLAREESFVYTTLMAQRPDLLECVWNRSDTPGYRGREDLEAQLECLGEATVASMQFDTFHGWDWAKGDQGRAHVEPELGPRDEENPGCEEQMMPTKTSARQQVAQLYRRAKAHGFGRRTRSF